MKLLVEFKKQLKEIQKIRKQSVQGTREEFLKLQDFYNRYYLTYPNRDLSYEELEKEFPTFYSWFPRFEELIMCYEKKKIKVNKIAILFDMVKNVIKEFQSEISKFQMIIDACDDDKVKAPISDFNYLLTSLELASLSEEDTCQIFGMFCNYCANYLKKHPDYQMKYSDSIIFLGTNAFLNDGSYRHITNSLIGYALSNIFGDVISSSNGELQESYVNMFNSIIELSTKTFDESLQEDNLTIVEESPMVNKTSTKVSRESLEKLRKYYKNAELVKVPQDISEFTKLLEECGIDESEKRYILRLVSAVSAKNIEPKIWGYLNDYDRFIYQRAFELLGELHHTNEDFALLLDIINEIKYIGELFDELNQEEIDYPKYRVEETMLSLELEEAFDKLRIILSKYGEEKESENTILFLLDENKVPYVKLDSDLIDVSFYKMVCNGIRKIRKNNQSNFRLVMTNDNTPYRVYDILSSKVHLSFVEIDNGIYVLIGTDVIGQGYEDIIRRVINHENDLKKLERLVKEETSRNAILTSHEQYFYLFNPDDRDFSRRRI